MRFIKHITLSSNRLTPCGCLLFLVLLQACSDTSTNQKASAEGDTPAPVLADVCDATATINSFEPVTSIVATTSATFTSGAHSVVTGDSNGQFTALNDLRPTTSDLTVTTYGDHFYIIERFLGGNSITKYAIASPQTVIWQYSVNDSGSAVVSDPHAMIFVSETKAYVLRYNSTKAWIVNPSATSEAAFKTGELDLSSYADSDGIPEMDSGVIVDGRLYLTLQRLQGATKEVVNDGYIAIFDITTDLEVDAGIDGDFLKGIPLLNKNPISLHYVASNNSLYVNGAGSFFPVKYEGGIEIINLDDFSRQLLLDDGDDLSHPYGLITELAVHSSERLFFVGYDAFDANTLYAMDTVTNRISAVSVAQLIDGMIQSLAVDPQGLVWVGDNANASVRIVNPLSCEEVDVVSTNLNPATIVFAQ